MAKINRLDKFISNRIAAGEVVEKPSSIVKELIENAIDAGSTTVTLEIKGGGIEYIRVSDNGSGMDAQDAVLAFERHATSKIHDAKDLESIATLGFRGEALSSIAAVSQIELYTKTKDSETGFYVEIEGGEIKQTKEIGCPDGTDMIVRNVFYNVPARFNFLKKPAIEAAAITDFMMRMILAHPEISFKYINNAKNVFHSMGDGHLKNALVCIYGHEIVDQIKPVQYACEAKQENKEIKEIFKTNEIKRIKKGHPIKIDGFVSMSQFAKSNRTYQSFFINNRFVLSRLLSSSVQEAFGARLMGGRFPLCVLHIEIPFDAVDVNVHPNKLDVRFKNEELIIKAVIIAVGEANGERRPVDWTFKDKLTPQRPLNKASLKVISGEQGGFFKSAFLKPDNQIEKESQYEKFPENSENKVQKKCEKSDSLTDSDLREKVEGNSKKNADNITQKRQQPSGGAKTGRNQIDDAHLREEMLFSQEQVSGIFVAHENMDVASAADLSESIQTLNFGQKSMAKEPELFDIQEEPFTLLGTAFGTYIIVSLRDSLYFIDQHAAHERMIYDQLVDTLKPVAAQTLLVPEEVELAPLEYEVLLENRELIAGMGFDIDISGTKARIQAMPVILDQIENESFLHEALDNLINLKIATPAKLKREKLALVSCKGAVKGNKTLSNFEIKSLLNNFHRLGELNCPHGRPIVVRITRKNLEKMFKRTV